MRAGRDCWSGTVWASGSRLPPRLTCPNTLRSTYPGPIISNLPSEQTFKGPCRRWSASSRECWSEKGICKRSCSSVTKSPPGQSISPSFKLMPTGVSRKINASARFQPPNANRKRHKSPHFLTRVPAPPISAPKPAAPISLITVARRRGLHPFVVCAGQMQYMRQTK